MRKSGPPESSLTLPVVGLFTGPGHFCFAEAPLARKKIDVLFVPQSKSGIWIAIELKVRDWKTALWQASVNNQLADLSYVALWHQTIPLALGNLELFKRYGVGIIEVYDRTAQIVSEARRNDPLPSRRRQQQVMWSSLGLVGITNGEYSRAVSLLSA